MRHLFIIFFISFFCLPHAVISQELYLLEGHQVLLYKIINCWYFAPNEDSVQLCGDLLEYKNIGKAKISFFQNSSTMKISVEGGFAPLLSVAEGCDNCSPSSTEAMWMNDSYFSNSKATLHIEESTYNNKYSIFIENINKNRLNVVEEEEKQLTFILTGTVQGLQNGKIALHPAGDFLGKCKESNEGRLGLSAVDLAVALSEDGPQLLKFDLSSRGKDYSVWHSSSWK